MIFTWQQINEKLDLHDFYEQNFAASSASSVIGSETSRQPKPRFQAIERQPQYVLKTSIKRGPGHEPELRAWLRKPFLLVAVYF